MDDSIMDANDTLRLLNDVDLVTALQKNPRDRSLQGMVYDRYSKRIYFKCLSIVKEEPKAKDYTHDIFIKIFSNIQQFKGRSNFSLWVHSITYNYCIRQISRKQLEITNLENEEDILEDSDLVQVPLDREEQFDHLQKCLDQLSQEDRILLSMKYWDDLKIEEIGKILKIEDSAVKMRLKRLRDRMKKHINTLSNLSK